MFDVEVDTSRVESDAELAIVTIRAKKGPRETAWRYYDGDHPIRFSDARLQQAFGSQQKFVQNWCAVAVDAVVDRMEMEGFTVSDAKEAETELNDFYERSNLIPEVYQVLLAMVATGEGFIIGDAGEDEQLKAFYSPPESTHVFYNQEDPRAKDFAAKAYKLDRDTDVLWVYYPEVFEKYHVKAEGKPQLQEQESNPWAPIIPVWHFSMNKSRPRPDFAGAVSIQDAVNKIFSDLMVSGDFSAFPFRWGITSAEMDDSGSSPASSHPFRFMQFPPAMEGEQNTQVGEFAAGDTQPFLKALDSLTLSFASITRTPRHYFTTVGGDPSGEALQAQEAPLIRKVKRYINITVQEWQEFGEWVTGGRAQVEHIQPVYSDPRTVQTLSQAQSRRSNVEAGIPIITLLKREGWREEEIEEMLDDMVEGEAREDVIDPEKAKQRADAAVDRLAEQMAPMAQAAMEAVRDGALDALVKSGALDKLLGERE